MNNIRNTDVRLIDLGLMEYQQAWDIQTGYFDAIIRRKLANREGPEEPTANYLILCEHPHVFTLGKAGKETNLVIPKDQLGSIRASYHQINRGGDITYHGPGQLVAYPILDLENFFTDIHRYMRSLEEVVILTLQDFGITASRYPGLTGVWLDPDVPGRARKICAMGVKTSRWVTLHGLALNVNTDLNYFSYIVPCGISDKAVTSMEKEAGRSFQLSDVGEAVQRHFQSVFGAQLVATI